MLAYKAERQGNSVLLSCSDDRQELLSTWSNLITSLLSPTNLAVVYNLDNFVKTILSIFPNSVQKELGSGGRSYCPDMTKLFYQPSRMFAITYAGRETSFYGLSRYSETQIDNPKELLTLGQKVIKAYNIFGITPTKLSSPVSVFSEKLETLPFPRACDLPDSALGMIDIASQHMTEEWREVFKLGHWQADEISDLDICAGYPSLIAKLPDISNAQFYESDTLPNKYSYGILIGELEVIRDVSPFQDENGIHYKGLKEQVITTDGLWLIKKWGGNFTLKHGWFFNLPSKNNHPFKETVEQLYLMRDCPNTLIGSIAKQISVGIYGMLAQRYQKDKGEGWKLGMNFNSIYAKMITDRCSLKVADFIYRNSLDSMVINITVDGFLTEGKLYILTEKNFGSWRINESSPALVASQLYAWHGDKHPNRKYYPEMIKLIKKNPKHSVYANVDLNLLEHTRIFQQSPRNGNDLLTQKYNSQPLDNGIPE